MKSREKAKPKADMLTRETLTGSLVNFYSAYNKHHNQKSLLRVWFGLNV